MGLSLWGLYLDGVSLLALAVVLGAIVYYVFFRDVWLTRRMKPLVEILDAGRLEGGRLTGRYSGKSVWFEYRAHGRGSPATMRIGVACPASRLFRIHKKESSLKPPERAFLENLDEGRESSRRHIGRSALGFGTHPGGGPTRPPFANGLTGPTCTKP